MLNILANTFTNESPQFAIGQVLDFVVEQIKLEDEIKTEKTGELKIKLLRDGSIIQAPFLLPSVGASMYIGGIPERGSYCVLLNLSDSDTPQWVAIGFLPLPLSMLKWNRKEIDELQEGEFLLQSSAYDGETDFWSGAKIKGDKLGRLVIEDGYGNNKIIIGNPISTDLDGEKIFIKDSITGQTVIYEHKLLSDKHYIRYDSDSNFIAKLNDWITEGRDKIENFRGVYVITTGEQFKLQTGMQFIQMDNNSIEIKSLEALLKSMGKMELNSSTYLVLFSLLDMQFSTSGNLFFKIVKDAIMSATNFKINLQDSFDLQVAHDIMLESMGGTLYLKSRASAYSLVRAEKLVSWLMDQSNLIDSLGVPVIRKPITMDMITPGIKVP